MPSVRRSGKQWIEANDQYRKNDSGQAIITYIHLWDARSMASDFQQGMYDSLIQGFPGNPGTELGIGTETGTEITLYK